MTKHNHHRTQYVTNKTVELIYTGVYGIPDQDQEKELKKNKGFA